MQLLDAFELPGQALAVSVESEADDLNAVSRVGGNRDVGDVMRATTRCAHDDAPEEGGSCHIWHVRIADAVEEQPPKAAYLPTERGRPMWRGRELRREGHRVPRSACSVAVHEQHSIGHPHVHVA